MIAAGGGRRSKLDICTMLHSMGVAYLVCCCSVAASASGATTAATLDATALPRRVQQPGGLQLDAASARSLLADAEPSAPVPPAYPPPPGAPPPTPPAPPLTAPALPMQRALLQVRGDLCPAARVLLPDWTAATDPCATPVWSHVTCGAVDGGGGGGLLQPVALDLVEMSLTGTLPSSLSGLTSLQELNLATNAFTGSLPPSVSALSNLILLDVSNNDLSGTLPSNVSALTALQQLSLGGNNFTGSLPDSWSTLVTLAVLDLSHLPGLTGALPPQWASLSNMSAFDASGNVGLCGPLDLGASSGAFSGVVNAASATADSSLNQTCPGSYTSGSSTNIAAIVAPSVIGGVLVLALAGLVAWYVVRRRSGNSQQASLGGSARGDKTATKHFTELSTAPTL